LTLDPQRQSDPSKRKQVTKILTTVARKSQLGPHKMPNPKKMTVGTGEPPARPYAQQDYAATQQYKTLCVLYAPS